MARGNAYDALITQHLWGPAICRAMIAACVRRLVSVAGAHNAAIELYRLADACAADQPVIDAEESL